MQGQTASSNVQCGSPHTDGCLEMHAGDSMHEHDRAEEWDQRKN